MPWIYPLLQSWDNPKLPKHTAEPRTWVPNGEQMSESKPACLPGCFNPAISLQYPQRCVSLLGFVGRTHSCSLTNQGHKAKTIDAYAGMKFRSHGRSLETRVHTLVQCLGEDIPFSRHLNLKNSSIQLIQSNAKDSSLVISLNHGQSGHPYSRVQSYPQSYQIVDRAQIKISDISILNFQLNWQRTIVWLDTERTAPQRAQMVCPQGSWLSHRNILI